MPEVTFINENGEKKSFHRAEMTTIVGCSCCGHIFRDRDTKMTMIRSQNIEKWIREWNPKYISETEYLVKDEETGHLVKKTVKMELKAVHGLRGEPDEHVAVAEKNPEPKYVFRKVSLMNVQYTCLDCLSKPVYISVVDQSTAPSNVLALADEIRALREEHGARLVMLGHGRKIDTAVELICSQLSVKFQEASE